MIKMLKKKTAVFVDYESWFYGMRNYGIEPDVDEVLGELERDNEVVVRYALGNLSEINGESDRERAKLSRYGYELEYTFEGFNKGNITDFAVVDKIYRTLIEHPEVEKYVLFSGDSHFVNVLRTLQELGKEVEIIAVRGTLSNLYESFNTRVIAPVVDRKVVVRILDELTIANSLGAYLSFNKCVHKISTVYGYDSSKVISQLRLLLSSGVLKEDTFLKTNGSTIKRLVLQKDKVDEVDYKSVL